MTNLGEFGYRMNVYEMSESSTWIPVFERGLKRPYDMNLLQLMITTAKHLMVSSGDLLAHTQSDEITLVFYSDILTDESRSSPES